MVIRMETLGLARVVVDDGAHVLQPTIRDQALAYLAVTGTWVTRDRLAYLFWPDVPDATARHNVRQLLKRIRRLGWTDGLETEGVGVRWQIAVDVDSLRTGTVPAGLEARGEFLPGLERNATFEFEEWLLEERRMVEQLVVEASAESVVIGDRESVSVSSAVVGRADELSAIFDLLADPACRLLTLLGPAGIGKSTIARELVRRMATDRPDGCRFVSLESTLEASDVASAMTAGLGLTIDERVEFVDQLAEFIGDRDLLVVVDNVEHLSTPVFTELLERCPALRIVATSRRRLRLADEWSYAVGGLGEADGAGLFRMRAGRLVHGIEVSDTDARSISIAVGGSPLGLELAASWVHVMSPVEIAEQLGRGHELLHDVGGDGSDRHAGIDVAMERSWELATAEERRATEALSVFAAPFDRRLAEAVADVTPHLLRDLMDKSLVSRHEDGRFASHQLVRAYASARLAGDPDRLDAMRRRHTEVVLGRLADRGPEPSSEDVVRAWAFATQHREEDLLARSAAAVAERLADSGKIGTGIELFESAEAALGDADPGALGWVRYGLARMLYLAGRHGEADAAAGSAVELAAAIDDERLLAKAMLLLGWCRKWAAGDAVQYETIAGALPIAERLGDRALLAEILNGLGCSASTFEACRLHLEQGLVVVPDTDGRLRARLLQNLGMILWALGDGAGATAALEAAVPLDRGDSGDLQSLVSLAFVVADAGDVTRGRSLASEALARMDGTEVLDARIYAELVAGEIDRLAGEGGPRERAIEALERARSVGNVPFMLRALRLLARVLIDAGDVERGLGLLALVVASPGSEGGDFTAAILNPRIWEEVTRSVSDDVVEEAQVWARGRSLDETVEALLRGEGRPPRR